MYLLSEHYTVNLIGAKSAFAKTLRNVWNLNTKSSFIFYHIALLLIIFFTEFCTFCAQSCAQMSVNRPKQKELPIKGRFCVHMN